MAAGSSPGMPVGPAALKDELLGLGPPERLVGVEHTTDHEGGGRSRARGAGQAGLEQAAVAVVEGQQDRPGG